MLLFPVKKVRKHSKLLLLSLLLGVGGWVAYLELAASSEWRKSSGFKHNRVFSDWSERLQGQGIKVPGVDRDLEFYHQRKEGGLNELVGQANLHIFEDWCGGSIEQLRKNIHFPLFPHTRTVVKKLAVAPRWTNYGLRIFGYIHPFAESTFQFAMASDDNSEFWLSSDDNPANVSLLARVGKTGKEWAAPGEFGKFRSQISNPVRLSSSRKYYFEVLHKQNDQGTDHVEVAWRLSNVGLKFNVIDSRYISLYINESLIKLNEVWHIPQSAASYKKRYSYLRSQTDHPADMLRDDPRDTFYNLPLITESHVDQLLPDCAYKPSYIINGFPILRYQGLQFVHLTYIYPNDYTRLTHMESENKCFYFENMYYLERFGFYKYMKMDTPPQKSNEGKLEHSLRIAAGKLFDRHKGQIQKDNVAAEGDEYAYEEEDEIPRAVNLKAVVQEQIQKDVEEDGSHLEPGDGVGGVEKAARLPDEEEEEKEDKAKDYGDDYDDYVLKRKRKLFFAAEKKSSNGTLDGNAIVDHQPTPARKGMEGKSSEVSRVKGNARGTHSPSQKNPRSFQKKLRVALKGGLGKQAVRSSARQRGRGSDHLARHITPGGNRDVGRPGALERQNNRLREKQKEISKGSQDTKRAAYAEQPVATLSGERVNESLVASLSSKDGRVKSDGLKPIDLTSPFGLKEERINGDTIVSEKPALGQNNGGVNPGPFIPLGPRSKKDTLPAAASDWFGKVLPPAGQKRGEVKEKGDGGEEKNEGEIDEKANADGKKGRKWFEPPARDDKANGKPVKEEEEGEEEEEPPDDQSFYGHIHDTAVSWEQTFSVSNMDFHSLRSDWIDLRCNVSGNLLMKEQEAADVVEAYMKKLNEKHRGRYTLHQLVSIEKRLDRLRGSRYLLELELLWNQKTIVRLSEYVYNLNGNGDGTGMGSDARLRKVYRQAGQNLGENRARLTLCSPTGFSWRRNAMIHFIVPVKNQARWVQQFIYDMEELYAVTGDQYFSVTITDYSSTDMDVENALKRSMLTRYQYVRLQGNFERSAGLQSGIDLIQDDHSIVFLCDLHLNFPPYIIDSIRKHCVEGKMAFAPIVMRLNCGSSAQEPDGYWEMNGFGLLGIYKSDLDRIGGMNTKEYRDRWGGEDWELLDRIFESGLEVERLYMRNFFHYFHSRRGMWNRKQG
ncbi:LOW QUALITY PROTEIN: beta-1,4-N-acetylgalactosaminyltransferase 3-like [Leucoraja erinacea]|uniref:LOW QUALITY PROTEIN: beta-1,4-N-acetylgalactosaminyltransferase 3-like n=1 Tax=Leucoraja erinaceus TaxID=7782 RepID=UPI002456897F|nr:LOW QUALITY PROTEIN: beta-1,4-N-acetylgalactosaminyltransferase 3-like [Leucoraja erinacea]